jgi:hypothetical protein
VISPLVSSFSAVLQSLLLRIGNAQQKDAVIFWLFGHHHIDSLPLRKFLTNSGSSFARSDCGTTPSRLAPDVDKQFRGTDLDYHTLADIAVSWHVRNHPVLEYCSNSCRSDDFASSPTGAVLLLAASDIYTTSQYGVGLGVNRAARTLWARIPVYAFAFLPLNYTSDIRQRQEEFFCLSVEAPMPPRQQLWP